MSIIRTIRRGIQFAGKKVFQNSPVILTGLGIAGTATTAILAAKETQKASIVLDDLSERYEGEIPKKVAVKELAKVYLPAILSFGATSACMIGATSISLKRNAVIASLYSASEIAAKEYHNKVVEMIGEKKEAEIRAAVSKDHLDAKPVVDSQVIITGIGDSLCYDEHSGRYFKTDIEKLRRLENDINRRLLSEMWVSLNEFYYELNLEPVKLGDSMGFTVDHPLSFHFGSHIASNGQPCLTIDYDVHSTKWR